MLWTLRRDAFAKTKFIFTCDDDVRPGDIWELAAQCQAKGQLATYLDASHMQWSGEHYRLNGCNSEAYETLLGWGSVFERTWIGVLLEYINFFGKTDDVFMREADRIFTMLLRKRHCEIEAQIDHLPGARASDAMYRQPGHMEMREIARDRCRTLLNSLAENTSC